MDKQRNSYIGKSVPRLDARLKVTGQARFGADTSMPGMLYGKVLRSPHPYARILHIDTTRAERLPGVRAVVTAADTPKIPYGFSPDNHDKYPLANEFVRYVGDEVAGVAAIDEDIAREALELIDVEYEVLQPVFDPVVSMQEGSPQQPATSPGSGWCLARVSCNTSSFNRNAAIMAQIHVLQLPPAGYKIGLPYRP